jgi:alkylhydroperoxidase/carboxymuconolactone decarboxylase family protein YurZ
MSERHGTDWTAAWEKMLGTVPQVAKDMRDVAPEAEEGYRKLRTWIYSDHLEGNTRATKELIMVVINIASGNAAGAVTHLKLGAANGLTEMQLRETLAQLYLSLGLIPFNAYGLPVWNAYKEAKAGG